MDDKTIEEYFLVCYDENADAIFRHCYYKTFDREVAKDLTQEAFTRTWIYISAGNKVENLRAFVFKVTGNAIIDWRRKKKTDTFSKYGEEMLAETIPDEREDGYIKSEAAYVASAIEKLPDQYREVVKLRYLDGLSPMEIADLLNERENTVSVRITRGVKKLRILLGEFAT
ncbi:sigma-70 family RNA polymerase sigma factor [bacterium]|nr:sigma-70 family RNA polymerase sigma factor [bacterium]